MSECICTKIKPRNVVFSIQSLFTQNVYYRQTPERLRHFSLSLSKLIKEEKFVKISHLQNFLTLEIVALRKKKISTSLVRNLSLRKYLCFE